MKALVLEKPGTLSVSSLPTPSLPGPGEALVAVHRIGICGTDLHAFEGTQPFFSYPRILGHELGVEVLAVGEGVDEVREGDRCSVEPYLNCGRCIACRRGRGNCCSDIRVIGVHADGGMRERFALPAAKLHRSETLSYEQLALVETLGIGAHAVQRAGLEKGETVAVVGAGPIGLSVIQFAQAAGARVLVLDVNPVRLAFCRDRLGIDSEALVNVVETDARSRLLELTGGDMPVAVLDATGNPRSMQSSFRYPSHGGRLVFVGLFQGEVSFSDPEFHKRELTLLGSRNSLPDDFRRIIKLVESGRVDTRPWITHRAAFDEVPGVFASWTRPESGVLKAMVSLETGRERRF